MQEEDRQQALAKLLPDLGAQPHSLKRGKDNSREQKVVVYSENVDAFKSRGPGGIHMKDLDVTIARLLSMRSSGDGKRSLVAEKG